MYRRGILCRNVAVAVATLLLMAGCDYFISAESRIERAEAQMAKGEYRGALIELKNALKSEPESEKARLLLAEVALWLGDAKSAEKELNLVAAGADPQRQADLHARIDLALGRSQPLLDRLTAGPTPLSPVQLALYRGQALRALGNLVEAERQFRAALEVDPKSIEAQVALADALAAQNKMGEALSLASAAVAAHPDSALAAYAYGLLLTSERDAQKTLVVLKRANELAPKQLEVLRHATLLAALTEAQLATGATADAKVTSDALTSLTPQSPLAILTASRVLMATNDYVAAITQLRQIVNNAPSFAQARFLLGVALLAQGNIQQAAQELTVVVNEMPQNLEARQLLAQVRMRLDDPDAALRVLVPGLQDEDAQSIPQLSALADSIRTQAGPSQAIEVLERALKESPGNEVLQTQLAAAYLQSGSADKAAALLRTGAPVSKDSRRAVLLLQAIEQSRGLPAARAEAESIVAANPSDARIVSTVAAFYARSGDPAAGRQLLGKAMEANPRSPLLLLTLGQIEWRARQLEAAATALRKALEIDPKFDVARLALAELELARNNVAAATEHLEQLRRDSKQADRARLMLARLALGQKDGKRADALIDEMVQAAPDHGDLRNLAGTLYLDAGRFDQALAQFRQGTVVDPTNATLWLNLGRVQMALEQTGPARESLERALSQRPQWVRAVGALAFLDLQSGDNDGALRRIADLKQQRPRDLSITVLDGEVQLVLRRYAEAAKAFATAQAEQPSGALATKIYQARSAGKLPDATQPLEQWLQRNPSDLAMRAFLAEAYLSSGQRPQAVQQYEIILKAQPRHVASLNNLAWVQYELRDPRAVETARRAYGLAPNLSAVGDTYGWILADRGQMAEGLPILKAAASAPGAGPEVGYHYAVALSRTDARKEALAKLEEVLRDHASFSSRPAAQKLRDELSQGTTGS